MAKGKMMKALAIVLVGIFILDMNTSAQELQNPEPNDESNLLKFSHKSEKAIVGEYPDLGVSFSSVMEKKDYVVVDIRLRGKKKLIANINYGNGKIRIQFVSIETGRLVKFTEEDLGTLNVLSAILTKHISYGGVGDALLSTLGLLYKYPPNEFLDLDLPNEESEKTKPEAWTSLCDSIGHNITGTYDITEGTPVTESETVGPCASGECFGRCGAGCGSPPDPLIQRFSQDCFDHDLCARAAGEWFGPCRDEWIAAADDFLSAPDCNKIQGDWTVDMTGTSCFQGDCGDIYSAKVYHYISGLPVSGTLRFKGGADPNPMDGRVSIYQGILSEGNQISGLWQMPTYMGPECGNQSAGFAKGNFTGQNHCGQMTKTLSGVWPWYDINTCAISGNGFFSGNATANRNFWNLNLEDHAFKKTNIHDHLAPSHP